MNWLREWCFKRRHQAACRALLRDVERRKASFEVQDYRKRREAALRGRNRLTIAR